MIDNERRTAPRVPCHQVWLTITIGDQVGTTPPQKLPPLQVRVDNISSSGLCLIATEPFELGQLITFSDADNLPAQGEVVWTCQAKDEYKAGIRFTA